MQKTAKKHRLQFLAILASAAIALTACASDSEATTAQIDPHLPESPEFHALTMEAAIGAGLYAAIEDGIAEDYGLSLEAGRIESSVTAVTSVVSGDAHAAQSSYFGVIDAVLQGLDLVIVSESYSSTPLGATLEALPDSGISSLADLVGKRVNVISLNSSHANKIKASMLAEGLDPSLVEFVELPYGEAGAALEQGTIDATSAHRSLGVEMKDTLNTVTVFDYGEGEYEGMAESGWVMSRAFAEQNPNTVAAFQCAIRAGMESLIDNPERYTEILRDTVGLSDMAIELDIPPVWEPETRVDSLQMNADLLYDIGALSEPFDISTIVIPQPQSC